MVITMTIPEFLQSVEYNSAISMSSPWYDISNWDLVKAINSFNDNTKTFFETVSKLIYYFAHPKILAWIVWNGVVKYSFWICLFICLFSVIAYMIGWQKGKSLAKGSIITYIIIMMFNSALS